MSYETVTKPALRALAGFVGAGADVATLKAAIEAAAAAGANRQDLIDAVGGVERWNALVRRIKKSR